MLTAKCIRKFKKNNIIYGYRLQDLQGNNVDVKPDQLKTAIRNQQITITNLTLTSDNRLVDTSEKQNQTQQSLEIQNIKDYIAKAKLLGFLVKEIPTYCNHTCYLISKSETEHTIYIPDDVTRLNRGYGMLTFTEHIKDLKGNIKVIAGHRLKCANYMFYECQAQSLDLSSFDTHNVTDMSSMFYCCQAQSIDLSSFDTHNVEYMNGMFYACKAKSLELSSFDTSNVEYMNRMFRGTDAEYINVSSFNTCKVTNMKEMFMLSLVKRLDLSSFKILKKTNIDDMFYRCNPELRVVTDEKRLIKQYRFDEGQRP